MRIWLAALPWTHAYTEAAQRCAAWIACIDADEFTVLRGHRPTEISRFVGRVRRGVVE
jgi:hypothetical protein